MDSEDDLILENIRKQAEKRDNSKENLTSDLEKKANKFAIDTGIPYEDAVRYVQENEFFIHEDVYNDHIDRESIDDRGSTESIEWGYSQYPSTPPPTPQMSNDSPVNIPSSSLPRIVSNLTSEDWELLSQLDADILQLTVKIMLEETIKCEANGGFPPTIGWAVSLATDKKKEKEIEEIEEIEEDEIEEETEEETDEARRKRDRKARLEWLERLSSKKNKETNN